MRGSLSIHDTTYSFPGYFLFLSHNHGEKSVEGLVPLLRHGQKWWTQFHNDGNMST